MTGPVTYEQLWQFVIFLSAAGGVVAGFLAWLWRIVSKIRSTYLSDLEALHSAIEAGEKALAEYKTHAAETFATKEGVTAAVGRVESAVDRLTQRIDRLLEAQAHHPPPRRALT